MTRAAKHSRRAVLGALAAGGLMITADETNAQAPKAPKTFVLVHGACHGGWCWRRVADRLEARGHKAYAPTMTGLGERSHLISKDIHLATHVTDVVNVIRWEELGDIVLVGHSYGGVIISGVAEEVPSSIASIVFLDALLPMFGMSSIAGAASALARGEIAAAAERGEIALRAPPAAAFRVNEKDRAWVDAMLTPQPIATITDTITLTGARDRIARKAYIRAVSYPQPEFDKAYAACKADKSWRTFETRAAGHDVMIDAPDWLTERLLELA
jgi:pimeloyl-ACP methyl ester carboxylesterase